MVEYRVPRPTTCAPAEMYDCELSERDRAFIEQARYYHLPITLRKRLWILWYKSLGYPHFEIAVLSSVSLNTVTATLRRFHQGGIDQVLQWKPYRPQSELGKHCDRIKLHFADTPPPTLKRPRLISKHSRVSSAVWVAFAPF